MKSVSHQNRHIFPAKVENLFLEAERGLSPLQRLRRRRLNRMAVFALSRVAGERMGSFGPAGPGEGSSHLRSGGNGTAGHAVAAGQPSSSLVLGEPIGTT